MKNLLLLFFVLMLSACGGGGGNSNPPPGNANPTGVWEGTFTQSGVGTFELVGLISNGQIRFISLDAGVIYEGSLTVSGQNFTGSTINYEIGGEQFATSSLTGTIQTGQSISGSFTSSNGDTGIISLTYDPITDRGSSLTTISSNWGIAVGADSLTISIDSNGLLTGSDTDSCIYNGSVEIIDADVNIYGIDLDVSSCGPDNGVYSGFAVVTDNATENDALVIAVTSEDAVYIVVLLRT